jgi:hypothetical protein
MAMVVAVAAASINIIAPTITVFNVVVVIVITIFATPHANTACPCFRNLSLFYTTPHREIAARLGRATSRRAH